MAAKGSVEPGAANTAQYRMTFAGMTDILFTKVGGLERMVRLMEMPDLTMQSTGQVEAGEVEVEFMAHHRTDVAQLVAWNLEVEAGTPTAKRDGTLYFLGADQQPKQEVLIEGAQLRGIKTPDLDSQSEGESVKFTGTLAYDQILFTP